MSAKWIRVNAEGEIDAAAVVINGDESHAIEFVSYDATATDRIIRTEGVVILGSIYEGVTVVDR